MKKFLAIAVIVISLVFTATPSAQAGYVRGYFRSNGTYVSGYYRTSPNAYKFDNYSYNGGDLFNNSYYSYPSYNYNSYWR